MRHFQNTFAIELQFRRQGVTIDGRDVGKPRSSAAKDNSKSSDNAVNLQGGNNDHAVIYPFSNITL